MVIIFASDNCDDCFSAPVMAIKFFLSGMIIIIASIYLTRQFMKTEKIIFNIDLQPLLETNEATDGVSFAGEGTIDTDEKPLLSPYTHTPCIYFHCIKEKYVGGKGKKWKIIENFAHYIPFYFKDSRGKIRIDLTNIDSDFSDHKILLKDKGIPDPANSEIDCDVILKNEQYNDMGLMRSQSLFFRPLGGKNYRKSEYILRAGTNVFVYGMISKRNNELFLHEAQDHPLIISKKDRELYISEFYQGSNLIYLVHVLVSVGFTLAVLAINYFLRINVYVMLLFLLIGNTFITGSIIFSLYNRIIVLKNRAFNSLSNINTEIKRRADLIPQLVEVVKEYSKYEKEVQAMISEIRTHMVYSDDIFFEQRPKFPTLFALAEKYPQLQASQNFQLLAQEIFDTEERIAYSREFYNRSVRKYNTLINQFPFLIVSGPLGMKDMQYISFTPTQKVVPSGI